KMAILRKLNKPSMSLCLESINIDNIDYGSRLEMYMLEKNQANLDELKSLMRDDSHNYIELSLNYAVAGFYDEAVSILELFKDSTDPMLHYYMAYYKYKNGDEYMQALNHASMCDSAYCFPNRLYDICVFEFAINADKSDSMAPYYLGNLLYDKGQWERAVTYFELSVSIKNDFPTVHRNLSLAYFNKLHDAEKALAEMETAFSLDEKDSRVFLELEQLYKRLNYPISTRLENMKAHLDLVETRDTLYTEYITLLNLNHEYETALEKTSTHIFHPWEGGEGKITAQYRMSHIEIAKKSLSNNNIDCAISHLKTALTFPLNLGEGKLIGQKDNDIYYLLGIAYEKLGNTEMANENFILSSLGNDTLDCAMYYNDQPPEMFFYQALADMKLGKKVEAFGKFNKLIDYGENHIFDNVAIDYFAVSLPDFLIYEADLDEKNYVHCCYLIALGKFGLGEYETSISYFEKGLALDTSHVGLHTHLILTNTYHAFI
ncbi:MAG: DUF5107 domain-containing protein, partial [Oscillospiraceae bacterium]